MKKYIVKKVENWTEEEIYEAGTLEEAKTAVMEKYPEARDLGTDYLGDNQTYATDEFELYIEERTL